MHNPTAPDDPDDLAEFADAIRMIDEFNLHTGGITYIEQGYTTVDGEVPARTIDEYLLVKRYYDQAYAELRRRNQPKGRKPGR